MIFLLHRLTTAARSTIDTADLVLCHALNLGFGLVQHHPEIDGTLIGTNPR
jgi:hypothetical protein